MDEALEKAIDEVGRDRVFMRARSHGWGNDAPPVWVWWGIVQELRDNVPPPAPRHSDSVFGFLGL